MYMKYRKNHEKDILAFLPEHFIATLGLRLEE